MKHIYYGWTNLIVAALATVARTGSYDAIFYGLAVVVVALGIGSWLVRLPAREYR